MKEVLGCQITVVTDDSAIRQYPFDITWPRRLTLSEIFVSRAYRVSKPKYLQASMACTIPEDFIVKQKFIFAGM